MKKHIFGFALFSFIFASFAFAFAFFYTPTIRRIEKIKQITSKTERPVFRPKTQQDITYRVLSSEFDLDSGEFTSNIHLYWNRDGKAPRKIFVNTHLFTPEADEEGIFDERLVFTEPFGDSSGTTITIRYKVNYDLSFDRRKNLYASFDFSQDEFSNDLTERSEDLSEFNQVLFIHGENSIIKK